MVRQDEDFGGGDRVEPLLDPAPDGGEERRSANDLARLSARTPSGMSTSDLRIFDPVSLGNVQLPVCSRPAYDFSGSRIA